MTRTRARADERSEKTEAVKKARRPRTWEEILKLDHEELKSIMDDRSRPVEERENAELRLQALEEEADRRRLAAILEDLAEEVGAKGGRMDWGEDLAHRILTDDDLLRIAELLDPDD